MIRHCVFLNLRSDHDAAELALVYDGLETLCTQLPNTSAFVGGPNRDFEKTSQNYASGFTIDFHDADALRTYAEHPEHRALGARLVAQCNGGGDGIIVFDLDIPDTD